MGSSHHTPDLGTRVLPIVKGMYFFLSRQRAAYSCYQVFLAPFVPPIPHFVPACLDTARPAASSCLPERCFVLQACALFFKD